MAKFNISIIDVLANEGGFNKNLGDGQGMTYRGLTRVSDYDWKGWAWLDNYIKANGYPKEEKIFPELENLVKDYYEAKYWTICRGALINNQDTADLIFSFSVASGGWAKQVNIAINKGYASKQVAEDSKFSDKAIALINSNPALHTLIYDGRLKYMQSLSSWSKFGKSWLRMMSMFPRVVQSGIGYVLNMPYKKTLLASGLACISASLLFFSNNN